MLEIACHFIFLVSIMFPFFAYKRIRKGLFGGDFLLAWIYSLSIGLLLFLILLLLGR